MENTVTLIGNAVTVPELRFLTSGTAVASFSLAVDRSWKNKSGDWEKYTSFFDVECKYDLAEHVAESVARGMRVIVTGRLNQRSWETNEGAKRSKVEVLADEVGPSLRFATAEVTRSEKSAKTTQVDDGAPF